MKTIALPALAVALGLGSIAAVTRLQGHADAARAAQVRLASAQTQLNALQGLPWMSRIAGAPDAEVHVQMQRSEAEIASTLATLQRKQPNRMLDEARSHLGLNFAALERVRRLTSRKEDLAAERLMGPASREHTIVTRALAATAADYDSRAQLNDREATLETAGMILLLVCAFGFFYLRSVLARRRLGESEREYRLLFDGNPNAMYVCDADTLRLLAVNDAAVRAYGYSRDEFLTMTVEAIHPPEQAARLRSQLADGPTGDSDGTGVQEHRRRDGGRLEVEVTRSRSSFGGRDAYVVLAVDVTAREQALRELSESERKYRELIENATDMIVTVDLEDRFVSVNAALERTLGYPRQELIGRSVADFTPPESHEELTRATAAKLSGGSESTTHEHELIAKDGRRVPIEVVSRLIFEEGHPTGVEAVCRDISKRKEAEKAVRQLEQRLRETEKLEAVGRLAGGIAHDFNNLLTAIGGYSDLALTKLTSPDDQSLREYVHEIRRAGNSATELTGQLLAFSRNQVLQPRVLDLNGVVRDMQPMLTRLIGEDVTVQLALTPDLGAVLCDPGQLGQVVLNLAVNARDAMPNGGTLTIATRNVEVDAEEPVGLGKGSHVALSVSDTGVGMDRHTRERIFEPFYTTKQQGTGLGLATVLGIVKQSNGEVTVYSEPGIGTTFKVYLPRSNAKPQDLAREVTSHLDDLRPSEDVRVLIAEDNHQVRDLMKRILIMLGYDVLEAATPRDALELSATVEGEIQLLLTDVVMPEMNGRELFEQLRDQRPAIKVLFTSGFTDDAILARGILASDVPFLQKPFSHNELARKLRTILADQPAAAA